MEYILKKILMNTSDMSASKEPQKDYSFLFQSPEEYEVKVNEEGDYLTDLDSFEIPETAFDSGEDITSTFMGNDSVEFPYVIGATDEDTSFSMPTYPTESSLDADSQYVTDTYIPDAEHVLNYEPSYRDYLNNEIEEYSPYFDNEKPMDNENPNTFDYNDYYDTDEDTFEYSDKMQYSQDEAEDEEYEEDEIDEIEDEDSEVEYEEDESDLGYEGYGEYEDEEDDEDEDSDLEYEEDEEEEAVEEEEEEEEEEEKPVKRKISKKEIEEALDYLIAYKSLNFKESKMSVTKEKLILRNAGFKEDVISSVFSQPVKKEEKISKNNSKLSKFIENTDKRILEKLYKEHKFSLKEQKLYEGFTELSKYINTQAPKLVSLMNTKNPTYEGLSEEDKKEVDGRFTLISNMITMIPNLYAIAMASYIREEEEQANQEPAQQGEVPAKESFRKRKNNKLKEAEVEADLQQLSNGWAEVVTSINRLQEIVNKNTLKTTNTVKTLGKIKALMTRSGNKLGALLKTGKTKALAFAKNIAKQWSELGTEGESTAAEGGNKPISTSKI